MNMDLLEIIISGVGGACLVFAGVIFFCWYCYWSKSTVGKLESENEQLRKQVAKYQLDNNLLQRQVNELVGMVHDNTEASEK